MIEFTRFPLIAMAIGLIAVGAFAQGASPEVMAEVATEEVVAAPTTPESTPAEISPEVTVAASPEETAAPASPEVVAEVVTPEVAAPVMAHSAEALALLEQMATAHVDLVTMAGDFTQRKYSELYLEEIESQGRFYCRRPDLFRYDYSASEAVPEATWWLIGSTAWSWVPELYQAEIYRDVSIGSTFSQVLTGIDGAVDELREDHWVVLADPASADAELGEAIAHIQILPLDEVDAEGFIRIDLWVDTRSLLPVQVKMVEQRGDEITIRLSSLELNPDLDDDVFDPQATIPDDADLLEAQ